jgi:uncharacterized protein
MKKVVFFTDENKIKEAFDNFNLKAFVGEKTLFKLHMGERGNKYFPRVKTVKKVVETLHELKINPFLFDTTVAYPGPRSFKAGYKKLAKMHGFNKLGADVVIDDKGVNVSFEGMDYEVAETLYKTDCVFAFSHVKGHIATGMGGAIKNFGMGGMTKKTKKEMHHASRPSYQKDKCTFCGVCAEVCPFNAIKIKDKKWILSKRKCFGCGVCVENCEQAGIINEDKDLQYLLACAAYVSLKDKNVLYLNDVNRISRGCDCDPTSGPVICPDIGYLVSDDIVAIDKASLDLIHEVKPDVFEKINKVSPFKQIKYGEDIGLGSSNYKLIEI